MIDKNIIELIERIKTTNNSDDSLMPWRVRRILLVSSIYDYYTITEGGRLSNIFMTRFPDLEFFIPPSIDRVSSPEEAVQKLRQEQYDLVISMVRLGDMNANELGRIVKSINPDVPIVILAGNEQELNILQSKEFPSDVDAIFLWLGDIRLFLAIIMLIEDKYNVAHDVQQSEIKTIVFIDDSITFYSAFLPILYTEILRKSHSLTEESVTLAQKLRCFRSRPKVLLGRSIEEGRHLCNMYDDHLFCLMFDPELFRKSGFEYPGNMDFVQDIKHENPHIPIFILSDKIHERNASDAGFHFIDKHSTIFSAAFFSYISNHLGFGDFIFYDSGGSVLSRASDMRTFEWAIQAVPEEYLILNLGRADLLQWLMLRAKHDVVKKISGHIESIEDNPLLLRMGVLRILASDREQATKGMVVDFSHKTLHSGSGIVRIGEGSLGSKGRGISFFNSLISTYHLEDHFPGVRIFIPPTSIVATDIFERFIEMNDLLDFSLEETDDETITRTFLDAQLPQDIIDYLWDYLKWARYPLAVRASSILEDAAYKPFAGLYKIGMICNNHDQLETRLEELCRTIKMVYASTFHNHPKAFYNSDRTRLVHEKIAIVLQEVVGKNHGSYLYPDFAGIGRSLNFYPMSGMRPEDGVVSVALGLGMTVSEGMNCVRFCPAFPQKPIQSFTPKNYLDNSQKTFLALDLTEQHDHSKSNGTDCVISLELKTAIEHGTLGAVGSVYSSDNNAVYDGLSRKGIPLVTMAGILKGKLFPLAPIMDFLLKIGAYSASSPVEIEFAANLSQNENEPHEFALLQIRPLYIESELKEVNVHSEKRENALCLSNRALGNGNINGITDIVYVKLLDFEPARTRKIAEEITTLNKQFEQINRSYLLAGPGRWGSADPWIGIPVSWAQISAARCIVETDRNNISIEPSQGSHFFQNITTQGIGYFTVEQNKKSDFFDYDWLDNLQAKYENDCIRHVSTEKPLKIVINGRKNIGVILK